ncbi:MAG: ribonuclease PH [candidate division WOR-3 bacterium]
MRLDGRRPEEPRPVKLECGFLCYAEGSCLAQAGNTKVLCAVSLERRVPRFLLGSGQGWVTAEYGLLPRSTQERTPRETAGLRGRTHEIRRFIGRSLRAVCDLTALGECQLVVDCDVIQADGGTRTLAVTGGFCALEQAVRHCLAQGTIQRNPIIEPVAGMSCGLVAGEVMADLTYDEDARADTDMNVVFTESGRLVEVQCTAERVPLSQEQFRQLLLCAERGVQTPLAALRSVMRPA